MAETIRTSFRDIAERLGLTRENAPRHPSNCTVDWIRRDMERGVTYFAIGNKNHTIGCVAFERVDGEACYLERLTVLPGDRRRGFGKALVERVLLEAKLAGAHCVSTGLIAEHTELRDRYKTLGFVEGESKRVQDLPFGVTVMSYDLKESCQQCAPPDAAGASVISVVRNHEAAGERRKGNESSPGGSGTGNSDVARVDSGRSI